MSRPSLPAWVFPTQRKLRQLTKAYADLQEKYEVLYVHYGVLTGNHPDFGKLEVLEVETETRERVVEVKRVKVRAAT